MSAEAGTAPSTGAEATTATALIEAEELEIVLPSGAGVGPWTGSIETGEQVLLLGPSGSGKSTLLRALAGAIPAHQRARVTGTLRVGGLDPVEGGVLALSQVVGFLGQDPVNGVCLPRVEDDVALPLESRAVPPEQIGAQVHAALAAADAAGLGDRAAVTLSGGQLQRAGLAAALVARPRLLLLDEPTAMLDADGIRAVREAVTTATASGDITVVLVEHRLDDWAGTEGLAGLPPRTIALDGSGRILADGPTPTVLTRHRAALEEAGCWLPTDRASVLEEGAPSALAPQRAETSPPAPPLLTVRDADLGHDGIPVLAGLDLDVHAGRLLAVVGRNGAGKSTLLGALSRLDPPLRGEITGAASGLVFQRPESQFLADSVAEELAASGAGAEKVERMLARLGLEEHREQSPFALSGGQQRRLSIGAMLLAGRPVLLTDEPGYGLDRAAAATVWELLSSTARAGSAVVVATHDLHMVRAADEVIVIAEGGLHGPMPPSRLLQDEALLRRAGLRASAPRDAAPSAAEPAPQGWLSRRNPTVLLALLVGLSIVAIALTAPGPLLVLYLLLSAGTMLGCRIGPLRLLRAQLPFAVFASGVFMVNVLSRPGHEPWPELPVRVTEEGIVLGTALALRALVIGLGALAVSRAAEPRRTLASLQQHAGLSARYACALLAGRRLLDDLPRRWDSLVRAHRVRLPLTEAGEVARLRPRHLLRCAFALLVDSIRSAERIAFALESRGVGAGARSLWKPVPLTWADAALAATVTLVVTAVLLAS